MSTLSFGQLEQLLEARGATPQQADVGAAVAEAESGGRTDAWGDRTLGPGPGQYVGSLGPWQIFGAAHPTVSANCAEDPNCAADQTKMISDNFTNWNAWSTFKSGAYQQFLASSADFVPGGANPSTGGDASGNQTMSAPTGPSLPDWLLALGVPNDVGGFALRGVLLGVGLILLIVGIIQLFHAGPMIRGIAVRGAVGAAGV